MNALDEYIDALAVLLAACACDEEDEYRNNLCGKCLTASETVHKYHLGTLRLQPVNVDNVAAFHRFGNQLHVVLHQRMQRFRNIQLLPLRGGPKGTTSYIPIGYSEVFLKPDGVSALLSTSSFSRG